MRAPRRVRRVSGAGLLLWLVCGALMAGELATSETRSPALEPTLHARAMDRASDLPRLRSLLVSIDGLRVVITPTADFAPVGVLLVAYMTKGCLYPAYKTLGIKRVKVLKFSGFESRHEKVGVFPRLLIYLESEQIFFDRNRCHFHFLTPSGASPRVIRIEKSILVFELEMMTPKISDFVKKNSKLWDFSIYIFSTFCRNRKQKSF